MGIGIAILIISVWAAHLIYCLTSVPVDVTGPVFYLHVLFQGYLYTGLFITAHDAMHHTVHTNKSFNNTVGWITSLLFAGMSYKRLKKNHFAHHRFPATAKDPDFYTGSQLFPIWWSIFLYRYITLYQLIIMAVLFNILNQVFREQNIVAFWIIPALLGTFQLFYFGTYRPHKYPHTPEMEPYRTRTLKKNHTLAMLTCYFFGYHYEHHRSPGTPWWQLYRLKDQKPQDV